MGKIKPAATPQPASSTPESQNKDGLEVKKELLALSKHATETLDELKLSRLSTEIKALSVKTFSNHFSVAVVGEFSHGKSTFINNLLGTKILPTDTLPTTDYITRIGYGAENRICAIGKTGKVVESSPLETRTWDNLTYTADNEACHQRNPEIKFLSVSLNNEWLKNSGIILLDTPGANDASKNRDLEISRALVSAEGALLCVDARKGLMETQRAFIMDRLAGGKMPFMALILTHLDNIERDNRDRLVLNILASLKVMKVEMPLIIPSDIEMPSGKYAGYVGMDKVKALLAKWRTNPERATLLDRRYAANVQKILGMALMALKQKIELITAKEDDLHKLIIEKKSEISAKDEIWNSMRDEIEGHCKRCIQQFEQKLVLEKRHTEDYLINRISNFPDPKVYLEQNYDYELSTRITAAIMSLDRLVTETATIDFQELNKKIKEKFKTSAERDMNVWRNTEDKSESVHLATPEITDTTSLQRATTIGIGAATAVGSVLGTLLFGIGGVAGSVGLATAARHFSSKKIAKKIQANKSKLIEFAKKDVEKVMAEATKDSAYRIKIIYSDMLRALYSAEAVWIEAQQSLIDEASKPAVDSHEKALENEKSNIARINQIINDINKAVQ